MRTLFFWGLLLTLLGACRFGVEKSEKSADWSRQACVLETGNEQLWWSKNHRKISYKCHVPKLLSIEETLCREASFRGEWKSCPFEGEYSFESLRSGTYFFEVKAKVSNGTWINSPLYFWKVDTITPTLLDFAYNFEGSSEIFHYKAQAIDSGGSGLNSWECRYWPVNDWKQCDAEGQGDFSQYYGVEKWEIRVSDRAGNISPSTFVESPKALRSIASHETFCQFDRMGRYWLSKKALTLSFTCLSGPSKFEGVEYEQDSQAWLRTPSARHIRFENLNEGQHKLKLRVRYSEGQYSRSFPLQFGIDSVAPKIYVSDFYASTDYFVARIESSDEGSGVQKQECKVDHESGRMIQDWTACNGQFFIGSSGLKWTGEYRLWLRAKDYANNYSEYFSRSFSLSSKKSESCFAYEHQDEDQKYLRVNFFCDIEKSATQYECRTSSQSTWEACQAEDHHLVPKTTRFPASFEVRALNENGSWSEVLFRYLIKN